MGAGSSRQVSGPVPATLPVTFPSTAICKEPQLPAAFVQLVRQIEGEQPVLEDLELVPDFIAHNRVWSQLKKKVKLVRIIHSFSDMAVLRVLLHGDRDLVIKGCPPESVERNRLQLAAEMNVANSCALHPLMSTVIAASEEPSGLCSVLPYAGVSFEAIMEHPDFHSKLTEKERTQVLAVVTAHTMTVHARLQSQGPCGILYRDTKPQNMTYDPATGQMKLIDFGLAMSMDGVDYQDGLTFGRFTPEMVDPAQGFRSFWSPAGRFMALNATTDVFLTGQQGLEMIHGLPQQLQVCSYDASDVQAVDAILMAHHTADYTKLIKRLRSSKARDFLLHAMAVDPFERFTPAEALEHPFLAATAAAVDARVYQTLPAHAEQVCDTLDLLAPLQGQPDVFLATWQLQQWREQQATAAAVHAAPALTAASPQQCENITGSSSSSSLAFDVGRESSSSCSAAPSLDAAVSPGDSISGRNTSRSDLSIAATSVPLAADFVAAPDVVRHRQHHMVSSLLHKLKRRSGISHSTSETSTSKGSSSSTTPSSVPAVGAVLPGEPADAVVFIEPYVASVPGWCGMKWFSRKNSSRLSSRKSF